MEFNKPLESVELSKKAKLRDLLECLAERYGEKFRVNVFNPSKPDLREDVSMMINAVPSRQLQGLETDLKNGDEIFLMPLFSGGG